MTQDASNLSAIQKVAVLMVALGENATAEILKHLNEDDVEEIAQAISELNPVSTETMDAVLEEFEQLLRDSVGLDEGDNDFARGAMEKALGAKKAGQILSTMGERDERVFPSLPGGIAQAHPDHCKEHPQTIAVILTQLEPEQAAEVFNGLLVEMQADIAYQMAHLGQVLRASLEDLAHTLSDELKSYVSGKVIRVNGLEAVSDMLDHTIRITESTILGGIHTKDPDLAERIRNRRFTFEKIAEMSAKDIHHILRSVDQDVLALKAADDATQSAVFTSMSDRAASALNEEIEFLGQTRLSDAEEAQVQISQVIRQLEANGQVSV